MPNRRSPLFLFGLTKRHHPLLKAVWVDPRCLNRRGPVRGPHMSNVYVCERHPAARMSLTPEQHSHIAAAYDKAAFDVSLPAQTRAAFAKKADWFRLLACIGKSVSERHPIRVRRKNPQPTSFGSSPVRLAQRRSLVPLRAALGRQHPPYTSRL